MTATAIRELAHRYRVTPSRALGQNFVIDPNTIRRVIRTAEVEANDTVLEIGAGLGSLTLGLADAAERVVAVELDRRLLEALHEVLDGIGNVALLGEDAMDLDIAGTGATKMVSNLPYNLATPLLVRILEDPSIQDLTVMVQKEVGERLVAGPGSKTYGAVSVRVAYHCDARLAGVVAPSVFWPQPRVASALVRMVRLRSPRVEIPSDDLMPIVKAAFAQRRKTVRNSLASVMGLDVSSVVAVLESADVDPGARAESLSIEDFARVARGFRKTIEH